MRIITSRFHDAFAEIVVQTSIYEDLKVVIFGPFSQWALDCFDDPVIADVETTVENLIEQCEVNSFEARESVYVYLAANDNVG